MARGYRDDNNRDRWRDEDRERSSYGRQSEDDRGFFERAGDEIRSWFGEDDERRPGRDFERERSGWTGASWDRDREMGRSAAPRSSGGGSSRGSPYDRDFGDRERGQGRFGPSSDFSSEGRSSFGGMAQGGFGRSGGQEQGFGPSRGGNEWRSMGDRSRASMSSYGGRGASRSDRDWNRTGQAQGWAEPRSQRSQSSWDRDENDSLGYGDFSGTLGGFGNQRVGSSQDDHYRSWRNRQMAQLDQDYEDYCREREQQFHSDFDSWRRNRPSPSVSTQSPTGDLGATPNAGVGTTTSSVTGTAGTGSAIGGGSTSGSSTKSDATNQTGTADTGAGSGGGRSGSRSRS